MSLCLAGLLLSSAARTADNPPQVLFDAARAKVLANIAKVPRYTCVETITRTQHYPQYGVKPNSCPALIAAKARLTSPGILLWRDRLRLDVAIADGTEMFSWAGAKAFETTDIEKLALSGSTGSGAFGSFLASVFGNDPDHYRYTGEENGLAVYEFSVPQPRSHYTYRMNNGTNRNIGYGGKFYIVPGKADLKRLVVDATDFPSGDVCRVVDRMDYTNAKIGSGEFVMPELSTMTVLYNTGEESVNETRFSGCHEYVGESTIRFDGEGDTAPASVAAKAALKALPPKTHVRVRLESPIDSDHAAAGDAVVGLVDRASAPAQKGDKLHGRILRLEQYMTPSPRWIIAIRFESIERDGVEQPVTFLPLDDGDRTPPTTIRFGRSVKVPLPKEPKGAGIFAFNTPGKLLLDDKFHSEWEVAKQP